MSKLEKATATRVQAEQSLSTATPENQAALEAAVQSAINAEASTALNAQAEADNERMKATKEADDQAAAERAEAPPVAQQEIVTLSRAPAREMGEEIDPPKASEPELLGKTFRERLEGSGLYMRNDSNTASFRDQGDRIHLYDGERDACQAALELAKSKGWDEVQWGGAKEALPKLWLEGQMAGVQVTNYKPTEQDLAALETRKAEREAAKLALATEGKAIAEPQAREAAGQEVSTPEAAAEKATTAKEAAKPAGERLVDHGPAPYQFNEKNTGSYFATLEGADGSKRTVWGVGIGDAIDEAGAKTGDRIDLKKTGSKTVLVPENGVPTEKTRNSWSATVVGDGLETTQTVAAKEIPVQEVATEKAATSEKPAVEATAGDAAMQEATKQEVAKAIATAQESARQEVAKQEAASREKIQAEAAKQEKAATEKAAKQEAAAQKAAEQKAERQRVKEERAARREAKLQGVSRQSVRYVTSNWGLNCRKIITTHRPTPKTDAARAAQRESAAAKVRMEQRAVERKKEAAALAAKAKRSERIAGRMEHLHGRKGITSERVHAVEQEMKHSQAQREAAREQIAPVQPPQLVQSPQERPAVQQAAPQVLQSAQPTPQLQPEASAQVADIDADKIADQQNQKAGSEAKTRSPQEFFQSLVKEQPEQAQEAGKAKALNRGQDYGAGL